MHSEEPETLVPDPTGAGGLPAGQGDRSFHALLLLRRGLSPAEIAVRLPNLSGRGGGVSPKSVEMILRSGARSLLSAVLLDRKPERLPDELWPPREVREAVVAARSGRTWRSQLRVLRAWLEGGSL